MCFFVCPLLNFAVLQSNCFTHRFCFSFRVEVELNGLPIHVVSAKCMLAIIISCTWVYSLLCNSSAAPTPHPTCHYVFQMFCMGYGFSK